MEGQDTDKGERAHSITQSVYKDLQTNFTHSLKTVWSTGKALHKSLEVTAQKAKAHYDAINGLGQVASQSEGTVIGIGHALMQMAEIYKELQHQEDENIAALKKELCNPLEFILLDCSEKMEEKLKKYSKEHSKAVTASKKASAQLSKYRKKNKSGQNNKEMQYYREATESKQRLDHLRLKHLKDALFEEKRCYMFAFEKIIAMTKNQALYTRKCQELLGHTLGDWEALTQSKDMSKDALKIIEAISEQTENNNGTPANGDLHLSTDSLSSHSGSIPRSGDSLPKAVESSDKPKVRAMYSHEGGGDNQLAFVEDDVILLFGNKRDGWHYGQNTRTKDFGWFPISFTKALRRQNSFTKESSSLGTSSMSKLSRSVADLSAPDDTRHHRSFFDFNNSNDMERSTMTLPHRKNNPSAQNTRTLKAGGALPPHMAALSQQQTEQLFRAHYWISHQMAPSGDFVSTNGMLNYNPFPHLFHHALEAPSSPPLPPPPPALDSVDAASRKAVSITLPSGIRRTASGTPMSPASPPPPPPPNSNQMVTLGPSASMSPPKSSFAVPPPPPISTIPTSNIPPPMSNPSLPKGGPPPPPPPATGGPPPPPSPPPPPPGGRF